MAQQKIANCVFRDSDECAVEHLQHVGEDRPVPVIRRSEEMRRFVKNEETVKTALLDHDAVALDISETADSRISEAVDQVEAWHRPAAGGEDRGDKGVGFGLAEDAMAIGIACKEIILEAAERRAIIPIGVGERQCIEEARAEHESRMTPEPGLHGSPAQCPTVDSRLRVQA